MADDPPPSAGPVSGRPIVRSHNWLLGRMARIGASAQAAIPGLYAWAITVAPAAWSRGAPLVAKVAAVVGVLALVTAPAVESARGIPDGEEAQASRTAGLLRLRSWTGPTGARIWSVWGFVLSSAIVWALTPTALSSARLDGIRGALGMVGWALFAFASAGPVIRAEPSSAGRSVRSTSLKPRSEVPGGDGIYVAVGVLAALAMQAVGWGVVLPERAVLVRLVTVVCGIAVLGGMTSIALGRHSKRIRASSRVRVRRSVPSLVLLLLVAGCGVVVHTLR